MHYKNLLVFVIFFVNTECNVFLKKHPPVLSQDELTTVRKNLQRSGLEVDNEFIRETWHPVYRKFFLQQSLSRAYDCRKAFYMYHTGHDSEVNLALTFFCSQNGTMFQNKK